MFLRLFKRLKPFALLVSLLFLSILYTMNSFFIVKCKNQVDINIIRPKQFQSDRLEAEVNKQLSLLREDFQKSLDQYETERTNLRKRLKVVHNTSLHSLVSRGKNLKQNVVCSNDLFLLIQVHSSPKNFLSRQAIRLSWGNLDHFIGNRHVNIAGLR